MAAILKSVLRFFSWTKRPIDSKLGRTCRSNLQIKIAKFVSNGNQDSGHGGHLENLFCASSEPKSQLTLNLIGSIRATCRSKIAKIVPNWNPRGPHAGHLEKLFCSSSPEPKGQLTWNLAGNIGETCRSKVDNIVPIRYPRWPQKASWLLTW